MGSKPETNEAAEKGEQDPPRAGARRCTRRAVFVVATAVVALLCITAAMLATGWPQGKLLTFALRRSLGAPVEVSGVSVLGQLQVSELCIFNDEEAQNRRAPTLQLNDVEIKYKLTPSDSRYISSAKIGSVTAHVDGANPQDTNYEFVQALLSQPATFIDPLVLIPRTTEIGNLAIDLALPSVGATLDGAAFRGTVESLEDFTLALTGEAITGTWWTSMEAKKHGFSRGQVDVHIERSERRLVAEPFYIDLSGVLKVDAVGRLDEANENPAIQINLKEFIARGKDFSSVLSGLSPFPIRFEQVDLSGTRLQGALQDMRTGTAQTEEHVSSGEPGVGNEASRFRAPPFPLVLADSEVHMVAQSLVLGPPGHELYQGDLELTATTDPTNRKRWEIDCSLNQGQGVRGSVESEFSATKVRVVLDRWSRENLRSALPQDYQASLAALPTLESFSATLDLLWTGPTYEAQLTLTPELRSAPDATQTALLTIQGHGAAPLSTDLQTLPGPLFEGELHAQMGDEHAKASVKAESLTSANGALELAMIDPNRWVQALTGNALDPRLDTRISGVASGAYDKAGTGARITLDLTASPLDYEGIAFPDDWPITFAGTLELKETFTQVSGKTLDIQIGKGLLLTVDDWSTALRPFRAQAMLRADVDLGELAPLTGLEGLWGEVQLHAPIRFYHDAVEMSFELGADALGYGDLAIPYGTQLSAKGTLNFDVPLMRGAGKDLVATLGHGTGLYCPTWSVATDPFFIDAPVTFETDLLPLVNMGLLNAAEGKLVATGSAQYTEEGLAAQLDFRADVPSMVLADAMATLRGVLFAGTLTYACAQSEASSLTGLGELTIYQALAANVLIRDVRGSIELSDGTLKSRGLETTLYDGTAAIDTEVNLTAEGLPVSASARIKGVDLETFTREYKPPSIRLTGVADGELSLKLDTEGLQDLRARLWSEERFTVNREAVERILRSQQTQLGLSHRALEKVLARYLGDEPQRPFERAELLAGLEDGDIRGKLALTSPDLNLTVEFKIDPEAIDEALQLLDAN